LRNTFASQNVIAQQNGHDRTRVQTIGGLSAIVGYPSWLDRVRNVTGVMLQVKHGSAAMLDAETTSGDQSALHHH